MAAILRGKRNPRYTPNIDTGDHVVIINASQVEFTGGKERTINIGVVTPSENGYYVQDVSNQEVVIVSKSAVDALLGLLTSPPYLETPTPSPVPATETPIPTTTKASAPASATATP